MCKKMFLITFLPVGDLTKTTIITQLKRNLTQLRIKDLTNILIIFYKQNYIEQNKGNEQQTSVIYEHYETRDARFTQLLTQVILECGKK